MRHPALLVALPVLGGVAASVLLPSSAAAPLAAGLPLAWLCAVLAFRRRRPDAFAGATVATAFLVGAVLATDAHRRNVRPPLVDGLVTLGVPLDGSEPIRLTGRLHRDAAGGVAGARLDLDVEQVTVPRGPSVEATARVRVSVRGGLAQSASAAWRAGRRVEAWALLRRSRDYRNPGVSSRLRSLHRTPVLVGSVKSARLVSVRSPGSLLAETAAWLRAYIRGAIAAHVAPHGVRDGAIVAAILIGDRTDLDDDVERRLQDAGTYHVIAISGGNIALLAGLVLGALRLAGVGSRLASITTIGSLCGYAYLVGDEASVLRATVVASVYLGARTLDLRTPPLNALAVAAAALAIASPLMIADAGFVLSFGATLGILIAAPRALRAVRAMCGAWPRVASGLMLSAAALGAATLSAELALFPVSAYVFSRVTFAGFLLNFAAIPLMSVAQVAGLATAVLSAVDVRAADLAGTLAAWAAEGLIRSADLVQLAPWVSWRVPPPPVWLMAAYYAGLGGSLSVRAGPRLRRLGATVSCVSAAIVLAAPAAPGAPPDRGWLRVVFLDVGQGDATLVQVPRGHSLLVDAGGSLGGRFDVGGRVVVPALWRLGTRRLDVLVVTHPDPDHAGGATAVLRDLTPREIWEGVPVPRDELRRELLEDAVRRSVSWRQVQAGDRVMLGPATVIAHHPPPPDWERQKVRNDDSLVLELRVGEVSIVLPGDAGADIERSIAGQLEPAAVRILKLAHHGSRSSSSWEFVEALRPAVAVVSAGRGNPFGHPAPAVLARFRAIGAQIFRTDEDGAVVLETDGHLVRLRTYTGRTTELRVQ